MILKNKENFDFCIKRLALQIIENYQQDLILVGIKSRGLPLAIRIKKFIEKELGRNIELGELNISLYRSDLDLIGAEPVIHDVNIPLGVSGKEIVLIDDILRTGKTAHSAIDAILDLGKPSRIRFATLIDIKKRELPIYADYIGWEVEIASEQNIKLCIEEIDGVDEISLY